ncbi:MAG: hypothetical protein ACNY01_04045 [Desulfobacteria bacterium]
MRSTLIAGRAVRTGFRKFVSALSVALLFFALTAGLFFDSFIKIYFPDFSAMLFVSAVIFLAGMAMAMIERNILIAILALAVTMMIPGIAEKLGGHLEHIRSFLPF